MLVVGPYRVVGYVRIGERASATAVQFEHTRPVANQNRTACLLTALLFDLVCSAMLHVTETQSIADAATWCNSNEDVQEGE